MKNILIVLFTASFAILISNGCQNKNEAKEIAKDVNEKKFDNATENDAKFVVDAYSENLGEIKAAELAKSKAMTSCAKDLADMMYSSHSKAKTELGQLAATKQITVPALISTSDQNDINDLDAKTKLDFDKHYADMMVDNHDKIISMFEKASTDCNDADIKKWAADMLPDLNQHLEMAKSCQDSLSNVKEAKK